MNPLYVAHDGRRPCSVDCMCKHWRIAPYGGQPRALAGNRRAFNARRQARGEL